MTIIWKNLTPLGRMTNKLSKWIFLKFAERSKSLISRYFDAKLRFEFSVLFRSANFCVPGYPLGQGVNIIIFKVNLQRRCLIQFMFSAGCTYSPARRVDLKFMLSARIPTNGFLSEIWTWRALVLLLSISATSFSSLAVATEDVPRSSLRLPFQDFSNYSCFLQFYKSL